MRRFKIYRVRSQPDEKKSDTWSISIMKNVNT